MNASNTVAQPIIIDATTEEDILAALRTLHAAVGSQGKTFPSFDLMVSDMVSPSGDKDNAITRIANRAYRLLDTLEKARREERIAKFRSGVADIVSPYIVEKAEARTAFLALDASVRKFLPSFGSTVEIPVEAVSDIFPKGTPSEQIVKALHQLGYKLAKRDGKMAIVAELPTK